MLSNRLQRIAARVASVHSSGDPKTDGYNLTVELMKDAPATDSTLPTEGTQVLVVNGMVYGQAVSGKFTVHISNGEFDGYEYDPTPGSVDITMEAEDLLQPVLDACAEELGLS